MPGPDHCRHGRDRWDCEECKERERGEREELVSCLRGLEKESKPPGGEEEKG